MLDDVPVGTLYEAILENNEGRSLADTDVTAYGLRPLPPRHTLKAYCDGALETAASSSLKKVIPKKINGVDSEHLVGASILFTMGEEQYPFYKLVTFPLNVQGIRNKSLLTCQLRYLKLLTLLFRCVPRTSNYWYSGVVYRGVSVGQSELLKAKYDNYEEAFAPGTKITFAAPTSTTLCASKASAFTDGIQYVIQGEGGHGGPGGVYFEPGDTSMYDEAEVFPNFPLVCTVTAATKPDKTVIVVLQVVPSTMTYLSAPPLVSVSTSQRARFLSPWSNLQQSDYRLYLLPVSVPKFCE